MVGEFREKIRQVLIFVCLLCNSLTWVMLLMSMLPLSHTRLHSCHCAHFNLLINNHEITYKHSFFSHPTPINNKLFSSRTNVSHAYKTHILHSGVVALIDHCQKTSHGRSKSSSNSSLSNRNLIRVHSILCVGRDCGASRAWCLTCLLGTGVCCWWWWWWEEIAFICNRPTLKVR